MTVGTLTAQPYLSLIIPVHNESAILITSLRLLREWLDARSGTYEVLLCENGSSDGTAAIGRELARDWIQLVVSSHPVANYGGALRQGLLNARGTFAAVLNIDLLDVVFLEQALQVFAGDSADIVIGSKRLQGACDGRSAWRRFLTALFSGLIQRLFNSKLSDTHGVKLLRMAKLRPLIEACELNGEVFDTELLLRGERAGLRIQELPITLREVRHTRYPVWQRVPSTLRDLARLTWHLHWVAPRRQQRAQRQRFYDTIAEDFDRIMNRYDVEKRLRLVFERALAWVPLTETLVLDAGCGTGEFAKRAAAAGARVVALDIGEQLLHQARRKHGAIWGVAGDLCALPMADGTFDHVICSEAIEHTVSPQRAVSELSRVLKPGGLLVLTTPNRFWYWALLVARWLRLRPYHGNEFWSSPGQLDRWVRESGCRLEQAWGFHLFPFVFSQTHRFLDWCDRFGFRLRPVMVNLGVTARKQNAGPQEALSLVAAARVAGDTVPVEVRS